MAVDGQQTQSHAGADATPEDPHGSSPPHPHSHAFPIRLRFFEELKRRNLARVGILYLIACWVVLEPTHVVFHMLEVPEWANRLVIILMAVGFPLVLLFSWVYELTPDGLKLTKEVDLSRSITRQTGRRLDRAIIAVLSLAVVYLVADKFWLSKRISAAQPQSASTTAAAGSAASPAAGLAVPAVNAKSIAVLPFMDMSEKKDQEYFSDGLSEELIDRLAHSQDLKVIARTSSFQFKGKNEDIRTIAGKLGVANLLEGSVRKDGKILRITAQLIRASDGTHLWSQTYERNVSSIFKVQDEIAGTVAQALHAAFRADQGASNDEPDIDAHNLVLQGNYFKERSTKQDVEKAAQLYRKAIEIKPDYALGWARLASAYFHEETLRSTPTEAGRKRILAALDQAIRFDPKLVWPYYTRAGYEMTFLWDWGAAKADLERVGQIDPDTFLLAAGLGDLALLFGQTDKALELYQKVLERDPLSAYSLEAIATAQCAANRLQACLQSRLTLLQLHPEHGGVNGAVGLTRLYLGQLDEALEATQKEPDEETRLVGLAVVYSAMGRRAESDKALMTLQEKFASTNPFDIADVHAYRAEADAAFRWLDRAYRQRDSSLIGATYDPLLRNLRGDPRYQALLVRMKLSDEQLQTSAGA